MQAAIQKRGQEEGWDEVKTARAVIAVASVQKAAERVVNQQEQAKKDSLDTEEDHNAALAKEVSF